MIDDDGCIVITNWDKYQTSEEEWNKKREELLDKKQQSVEKARQTKKANESMIFGLIKSVNELNLKLKLIRFTITDDGRILDSKTGEVRDLSDVNKEFDKNGS
jgi:hypothetical protein